VQSASGRVGSRVSFNFWVGRVRSVMLLVGLDRIKRAGDNVQPWTAECAETTAADD